MYYVRIHVYHNKEKRKACVRTYVRLAAVLIPLERLNKASPILCVCVQLLLLLETRARCANSGSQLRYSMYRFSSAATFSVKILYLFPGVLRMHVFTNCSKSCREKKKIFFASLLGGFLVPSEHFFLLN